MNFHEFTFDEFESIKQRAMLNEELSMIFELKIKSYSTYQIAMELNLSERTVTRRIKQLKDKIKRVL